MSHSGPRCVLGITGNIASGKSTVVQRLVQHGATHFDADLIYRELVGAGQPLLQRLADHFGSDIVAEDGSLNRPALGAIVFADPAKLRELDELTHPTVIAEIDRRIAESDGTIAVIDAVKLVESGHADHCDEVWAIDIPYDIQVARLMQRNTLSVSEARRRIDSQGTMDWKLARADRVLSNSGTHDELVAQADDAWTAFLASPPCRKDAGFGDQG